jgi:hypothetical protein
MSNLVLLPLPYLTEIPAKEAKMVFRPLLPCEAAGSQMAAPAVAVAIAPATATRGGGRGNGRRSGVGGRRGRMMATRSGGHTPGGHRPVARWALSPSCGSGDVAAAGEQCSRELVSTVGDGCSRGISNVWVLASTDAGGPEISGACVRPAGLYSAHARVREGWKFPRDRGQGARIFPVPPGVDPRGHPCPAQPWPSALVTSPSGVWRPTGGHLS